MSFVVENHPRTKIDMTSFFNFFLRGFRKLGGSVQRARRPFTANQEPGTKGSTGELYNRDINNQSKKNKNWE